MPTSFLNCRKNFSRGRMRTPTARCRFSITFVASRALTPRLFSVDSLLALRDSSASLVLNLPSGLVAIPLARGFFSCACDLSALLRISRIKLLVCPNNLLHQIVPHHVLLPELN